VIQAVWLTCSKRLTFGTSAWQSRVTSSVTGTSTSTGRPLAEPACGAQ